MHEQATNARPEWAYLTADLPGIPAAIKRRYEDFVVDEIPAYGPSGQGDHVYFRIEKAGLATMRAVQDIARALNVKAHDIGLAGLKDARAVTRQTLSLEHVDPQRIAGLAIPRIKILSIDRHTNKLRIGHLRGNRFIIKLRDVELGRADTIRKAIERLARLGVPNYFGSQRFGLRGDTWQIGRAFLRSDFTEVVALVAGRPGRADAGPVLRARELFDAGQYDEAAEAWPWGFRDAVRVCRIMARTSGNAKRAALSIDRKMIQFYVSAYQSKLFNDVVSTRIDTIDTVLDGDLAWKHDNGAVFRVEDAAVEAPRAARFEISPTGPLFGPRMTRPTGVPAEVEDHVLREAGTSVEELAGARMVKYSGGRRPMRFKPEDAGVDAGVDDAGPFIELQFTLASGCYATSVLREICKAHLSEGLSEEA